MKRNNYNDNIIKKKKIIKAKIAKKSDSNKDDEESKI